MRLIEQAHEPTNIFTQHYTPATRVALEAMQLSRHDRLLSAAQAAGFDDIHVVALDVVQGWETSPGSDLPYALVGQRP